MPERASRSGATALAASPKKSFRTEKRLSILGYPVEPFTARKVECPCRKCALQIEVDSLFQHMRDAHRENTVFTLVDGDSLSVRYPINIDRLNGPHNSFAHCWSYDGKRFIARFQQLYPTWYAWLYVVDGYQAADEYHCVIEAVSKEDGRSGHPLRTTYSGPVHAIDTPKKEIRNETPHCLQLTEQTVRHYCDRRAATDEEKEVGFNAVVNIRFKIVKRIDEEVLEEEEEEDYHDVSMDSGSTKERRFSSSAASDMTGSVA